MAISGQIFDDGVADGRYEAMVDYERCFFGYARCAHNGGGEGGFERRLSGVHRREVCTKRVVPPDLLQSQIYSSMN